MDPREAAAHHGDKHVIKMILESVQMLITCHHHMNVDPLWKESFERHCGRAPYKPTHSNHPCNKWIRETSMNYEWLACLAEALCEEKNIRWTSSRPHACEPMVRWLRENCPSASGPLTPPPKAMPEEYKVEGVDFEASLQSYKNYYAFKASKGIVQYKRLPHRMPKFLL